MLGEWTQAQLSFTMSRLYPLGKYGFDVLLSSTSGPAFNAGRSIWLPDWLNAINENSNSLFLTIGPGDFLVHYAIALGLHTTTLILVKGALDARGSQYNELVRITTTRYDCKQIE